MLLFKTICTVILVMLLSTQYSSAQVFYDNNNNNVKPSAPAGPEYHKVPFVFTRYFRSQSSIEEILLQATAEFRRLTKDGQTMKTEDIQKKEEHAVRQQRVQQLSTFLRYDLNFDAKVTKEEIESTLKIEREDYSGDNPMGFDYSNAIDAIMANDTDGDGVITYTEMSTLRPEAQNGRANRSQQYSQYLVLDENKDGAITIDELQQSLRKAFAIVDLDKNSIISREEYDPFRRAEQALSRVMTEGRNCTIKAVPDNVRFIALGNYEGASMPTVTTVGQEKEMSAAEFSMKAEGKPLRILIASYDSMIFKFSGNLEKVEHVYISSDQGGSGVANLPKEKVTFIQKGCLRSFHDSNAPIAMRENLQALMGRAPDLVAGQYKIDVVNIYDDRIEYPITHRDHANIAPKGFDPEVWKMASRFNPAGVMEFDPKEIVSLAPAKAYEVLPGQVGLAKLVHDGALRVVNAGTFEIVKPFARYPSGLAGAHAVTFFLPADMSKPKGSPGHSCVIVRDKDGNEVERIGPICRVQNPLQ